MIKIIEQFLNFFRFFVRLNILENNRFNIILSNPVEKNLFFYFYCIIYIVIFIDLDNFNKVI